MTPMTANRLYSIARRTIDLRCSGCGATAVRMWRLAHMTQAKCAACSLDEQADQLAYYQSITMPHQWPDGHCIGDRIPAVLDENGSTWGLSSIPHQAFALWRSLPDNLPEAAST